MHVRIFNARTLVSALNELKVSLTSMYTSRIVNALLNSVRPNRCPGKDEPAKPAHLKLNRTEPLLQNDVVSRLKATKMVNLVTHSMLL